MLKRMFAGCVMGMALATPAFADITNQSGDIDAPPARDMFRSGIMCKSADVLFEFYEKVPLVEQGRKEFVDSFFKQYLSRGECWKVQPSGAFFTGIRYAYVKRTDKSLPSVVVVPRVVVGNRVGFILPVMLRMNLPQIVKLIVQKNTERGWPAIQLGIPSPEDSSHDETFNSMDDLIRARTAKGWVRPPSARNGMTVKLRINMSPDGTVTSVNITSSSGDAPFDSAAVKAVKSISPLLEMNGLKPSDFQPYRSFMMTFRPEALAL